MGAGIVSRRVRDSICNSKFSALTSRDILQNPKHILQSFIFNLNRQSKRAFIIIPIPPTAIKKFCDSKNDVIYGIGLL